jgi:hypothetical protein
MLGASLEAGQFTLALYDASGYPEARAVNASDGIVQFPPLELDQPGTFHYTMRQLDQDGVEPLSGSYPVHITINDVGGGVLESKATYPEGYPVFTRADPDTADTDGESGGHESADPKPKSHDPVDQKSAEQEPAEQNPAEPSARKSSPKKKPTALPSHPNADRQRPASAKATALPRKRPVAKPVNPITPDNPTTPVTPNVSDISPASVSLTPVSPASVSPAPVSPASVSLTPVTPAPVTPAPARPAPPKAASLSIKANVAGIGADIPRGQFTFTVFDGNGMKVSETRNGTVAASPAGADAESSRARRLAEVGKVYGHYAVGSTPRGMAKPIYDPVHRPIVSTKPAP